MKISCIGQPAPLIATELRQALLTAYDNIKHDFGQDIFTSRKGEVETDRGTTTIGDLWYNYQTKAGFPSHVSGREQCGRILIDAGLSRDGETALAP